VTALGVALGSLGPLGHRPWQGNRETQILDAINSALDKRELPALEAGAMCYMLSKGANPHDFVQTNSCGSSVAPGASCTISVSIMPTAINTVTASLSIAENAPGGPQKVSFSGTDRGGPFSNKLVLVLWVPAWALPAPAHPVTLTNMGRVHPGGPP
jgi:hypothetical protein